jgi:metal-responsive CopG/Arc/MetJ family transcriptional regulator
VTDSRKVRVTVDLKLHLYERLEALEELSGADSKADVIREALQLYEFIVKRVAAGSRVSMKDRDGQEEVLSFFTMPGA